VRATSWKLHRLSVALAAAVALWATFTPGGQHIEGMLLDGASRFVPQDKHTGSVAVVAIDEESLNEYGDWPWPRDLLATIVKRLHKFSPKAIGLMLPLDEAETPARLASLQAELDTLDAALRHPAADWLATLDSDTQLANAIAGKADVILAAAGSDSGQSAIAPQSLRRFAVTPTTYPLAWHETALRYLLAGPAPARLNIAAPLSPLTGQATWVGVSGTVDGWQRTYGNPLLIEAGGIYLPSFELAMLAGARGLAPQDLSVTPGIAVNVDNKQTIPTTDLAYYPRPAPAPPVYSVKEFMTSDKLARSLAGRIVLLGTTAPGVAPELRGYAGTAYTPVTWSAYVVDSLLAGDAFEMPRWFYGVQRGLIVLFAIYLILLPPRWHGPRGLLTSGLLASIAISAGMVTLIVGELWLPVAAPSLFLLAMQLFLTFAYRRYHALQLAQQAVTGARAALGRNFQSQGQLDLAMDQFIACLPDPAVFEPLYELGRELERRRQMEKARAVYARLQAMGKGYRDSQQRHAQLADLSQRFPNSSPSSLAQTLVLDNPVVELPVLGRYRLERELGRGAMGTVYLAVDPTISRKVAVKTLPLLQEYDGREQEEVAKRFFKEAEAIGRLDHANIVGIHDAGKEHDLAYMAMDYVDGQSLDAWTAKSSLLPVWEVLEIAAQVADALDYAHMRKVVHRDIKPANIIYDRDSGIAKITDFGVARILDTSRTRTGTVLGSPSYMSPEQVAGKKTDGRSDLFSLGTTLYQLLTGSLPFCGDSVATMMYQIANQKTPAIRKYRSGLPACVGRLITKALQKEPARRFASGAEMAIAIRKCRAQFRGGRRKTA